ncbi:MAG: VOC family protein [Flavisolibacter sp.]
MEIKGLVKGLHHITATVNDAQEDYDFYTKALGLRLVKETVNFDNDKVYHFYYANKTGAPSTVFTTFPYKGQGVRDGLIGAGQASHTAFSVPVSSIDFWKARLQRFGIAFTEGILFDKTVLDFNDPSGLHIQILGSDGDEREPVWEYDDITRAEAIRGMHHAILLVHEKEPVHNFLEAFGYIHKNEEGEMAVYEAGAGGAGNILIVKADPNAARGINGLGTVHHVAHRVDSVDDSLRIKAYMESEWKLQVTNVLDRKYFRSIYFRIPGGVLFEVATSGPGFSVDESLEDLGSALKLPDWQEPNRGRIEANLLRYKK